MLLNKDDENKQLSSFDEGVLLLHNPHLLIEGTQQHSSLNQEEQKAWNEFAKLVKECEKEEYLADPHHKKYHTYRKWILISFIGVMVATFFLSYVSLFAKNLPLTLGSTGVFYTLMFTMMSFEGVPFFRKKVKQQFNSQQLVKIIGYGKITHCPQKQQVYDQLEKIYQDNRHNLCFWDDIVTKHSTYLKKTKPPLVKNLHLSNLSWNKDDIVFIKKDDPSLQKQLHNTSNNPSGNPPSFWV